MKMNLGGAGLSDDNKANPEKSLNKAPVQIVHPMPQGMGKVVAREAIEGAGGNSPVKAVGKK